jgi:hypothetical protein
MVDQSLILRALSMALPVASISLNRFSWADRMRMPGFSSSSLSSSPSDLSSLSPSPSSSSLLSLLESPAPLRKRFMPVGFAAGAAGLMTGPSSSEDMSSSSEDCVSESESELSPACLKNLDIVIVDIHDEDQSNNQDQIYETPNTS